MIGNQRRTIVVAGATGLQGGAVARRLLFEGWAVRALTRNPGSEKAQALSALGAEVAQADMDDPGTLAPVFSGVYGVYNVQNPMISGEEGEIRQGKNVAEAAARAGVAHLVYGSAGTGARGTGIPSWETKLVVEDHMKSLGLPLTVLRPMAFMELMTEKKFFPAVGAWQVMPIMMGGARKVGWLCAEDLGRVAARVFADPQTFTGREISLASDVRSIDECRQIYREVMGKDPPRYPVPAWLFAKFGFAGKDLSRMWRWLRTEEIDLDTGRTRQILPDALSVREWLMKQKTTATTGR